MVSVLSKLLPQQEQKGGIFLLILFQHSRQTRLSIQAGESFFLQARQTLGYTISIKPLNIPFNIPNMITMKSGFVKLMNSEFLLKRAFEPHP